MKKFLTLEEAKAGFEIGVKGNFLVEIAYQSLDNSKESLLMQDLASRLGLIAPTGKFSFLPITSVTYLRQGMTFQELNFGENKVSLPYIDTLPEELNLEYLDDNLETLQKGLLEWYKITPQYRTGRIARNMKKYCFQIIIYHFDKPKQGSGLDVVAKEYFDVISTTDIQASNTQGATAKTDSMTLKVIGYKKDK